MSGRDFVKGIVVGAVLGGVINMAQVPKGNNPWNGNPPNPKVEAITTKPAGIVKTGNAEIKTDAKLPSTTQTSTAPTTQVNTATTINKELGVVKLDPNEFGIAKTPVGSQGEYMNAIGNNKPAMIDGINYSGHALDQMQGRGILSPSVVKDAIMNPMQILNGNTPNTFIHIGNNGLRVIMNSAGKVITVY